MLDKTKILTFLRDNLTELKLNYSILKIGLIGSFARDEQNEESDIDLLIEFVPGTTDIYDIKLSLKQYLGSAFNKDIDICREKYLKPFAKKYLLKEVIYA